MNGHLGNQSASWRALDETRDPPERLNFRLSVVRQLRARAARYRLLAEMLADQRVIAEVQACANELDAEAASLEALQGVQSGRNLTAFRRWI